jgi:hypothetical protein
MGVLLIACPVTGKEFSTGIQADRHTAGALPAVEMSARCPYCRIDHPWKPRDARRRGIPPSDCREPVLRLKLHCPAADGRL